MVLLISVQDIKDLSVLDNNIEDKYIIPNITKCQDFIVKPLLGEDKYIELTEQIRLNTLTSNNKILLEEYIQPVIVYYVISEVIYTTAYKLKNLGVADGDQYKFDELVRLSKKYLIDSEQYQQILKEYMCDNSIPVDPEYDGQNYGLFLGVNINKKWRGYDNSRNK